jgi:hypothetical protein
MGLLPIEWVKRVPNIRSRTDQGAPPAQGRTASAGKNRIPERLPRFRGAPYPRPLCGKSDRGQDPANLRIFRRGPMEEPLPHDVLAWAGGAPWARANIPRPGGEPGGRWKINRNHPLDWEKTKKLLMSWKGNLSVDSKKKGGEK